MILKALTDSFDEINFTFSKLVLGNPFESDEFNCPEKNDEELSKHSFGGIKMLENSPVLCTAGLNLIRTAGCYLELMGILTPVSFEVFLSLSQFYEFLVRIIQIYAVYHIFSNDSYKSLLLAEFPLTNLEGEDLDSSCDAFLFQNKYKTLRTNIVRIKDFLDSYHRDGINSLTLNHNPAFSIAEALVAIASSRHLLAALKSCRSYIDKVIPSTQSSYTDLFFNSQEVLILELEDFILVPQISKILKIEWVHNVVVGLKWEEKKGDVNQYVNRLLHLISDFKEKLLSIGGGSIPQAIQAKVLLKAASFSVEQLLEAYGKVKRCNLPGREQMKIDFKGLITGLNTLTEIRNISRFEEYIEIWSHSAEQICNWIEANTEFSLRVQKSLFTTAPLVASLNKASRNHMLVGIESVYRQKLNS